MEKKQREISRNSSTSQVWCLVLVLLVSICHSCQAWSSYGGLASAIIDPSRVKQVSWKPRAFVYKGFLTEWECDYLISIAKPHLKRSMVAVADDVTGESKLSNVRTSFGMFIPKNKDPIVAGIEDKISSWTFLPKENGEDIQVLRYELGQKYEAHFDYLIDKFNIVRGGNRLATVLMYLTDVTRGGETVFPFAKVSPRHNGSKISDDLSECAKQGIAVKPRRGDALLFFNLDLKTTPDLSSAHAACPVIEGEKWSAVKWIHVNAFDELVGGGGECSDQHENCASWATLGECTNTPGYMVGSPRRRGFCMKSCNAC